MRLQTSMTKSYYLTKYRSRIILSHQTLPTEIIFIPCNDYENVKKGFCLPSIMKTICKEANTKNGCKNNPNWLEHWHIKRALYLHAPYMDTGTDYTPKDCLQAQYV